MAHPSVQNTASHGTLSEPHFDCSAPRVLITGIAGFSGSHLAEYCLSQGAEVHGIVRSNTALHNLQAVRGQLHLHVADLLQAEELRAVVAEVRPKFVFHLAAQASVPLSWQDPAGTIDNNVRAQVNLLDALRDKAISDSAVRIHLACSSEEYGGMSGADALTEDSPLQPRTPYGISKVAQDMLGAQYAQAYGMYIVRTRAFNHIGPRMHPLYAISSFAEQIKSIERGEREAVIKVGNLKAQRNYTDVRDIVRAYWLALQGSCEPGEVYNVCGARCVEIGAVLEMMIAASEIPIRVVVDPARLRAIDVPRFDGDSGKFRAACGWQPKISLEETIVAILRDKSSLK